MLGVAAVLVGTDVECVEDFVGEIGVRDLVAGADVVDLADLAAMQDGVECVGCVAGVEVATGVGAVAVEDEGAIAVEEGGELGDDFCAILRLAGQFPLHIVGKKATQDANSLSGY